MKRFVAICIASGVVFGSFLPSALALAPFKKAFQEKYVDKSENEGMKEAFQKASCNVCHVKGKKKSERNEYGDALAELIEGDAEERLKSAGDSGKEAETKKLLEELEKAFDEVAKKKNKAGELFGDILKAGKLPIDAE